MKFFLSFIVAIVSFSGCTSHSNAFDFFKFDTAYEKAITYTQSATLMRSFETKAILSSVYLNKVYPKKYKANEAFFIALYSTEKKDIFYKDADKKAEYVLRLNNQVPVSIKPLDKDALLRKEMPIQSAWNHYYLVEFAHSDADILHLTMSDENNNTIHLQYKKKY